MRRLLPLLASIALSAVAANAGTLPQARAAPGPAARANVPAPQVPIVTVLEARGAILASIPAGADATVLRSFRLSTTRTTPLPLSFQPNDLKSDEGAILDRRTIRVKEPVPLEALPQDYLFEVTGLNRSGTYRGTIEVRSTAVPNVTQSIPVEVVVNRPAAVGLAVQTPKFALKRATSCDPLMETLGFGSLCAENYQVALTGSHETIKGPELDFLLVRPDGSAVGAAAESRWASSPNTGRIDLKIPDNALDPGHYTGRVRATFGDRADPIDVPVEIDIRWKPWWPLVALLLGILIGRLQAYMQRTGNSLLDSMDRLGVIRARSDRLPDDLTAGREAVATVAAEVWGLIELGQAETAAARTPLLERCVDTLERVAALNPTLSDPAQTAKFEAIVKDVATLQPDAAATKLTELKELIPPTGGGGSAAAVSLADTWQRVRTVGFLRASRPVLYLFLLVLLVGAGLKVLYLDGGATLGAEPLADLLAMVTWGLSADVMSRTVSAAAPALAKK
jgi:hypothetical protein